MSPDSLPPPPRAPWGRRALGHAGVLSVWGAGLTVCVVALALIGAIWLSRQPAGHRLTFALANRALANGTNLRLTARRSLLIEHGADLVSPVLEIVDSSGTRHPFLEARSARLVTSWWGLLSRSPRDVRIELVDPVITLTRNGRKGYLLPQFKPRTPSGREPSPLAIDLGLKNALVRMVGGGAPTDTIARALDLTGRMHGAGRTWDFALGRFNAILPGLGLAIEKAEGALRIADDHLALDRLRMRTGAGWIEAAAAGPIAPRFNLEGRVKAGEWTWHDLSRLLRQPALDIPGGIAGEARVRVRPDTLSFDDARAEILWRDEPGRARFDARWARGRLTLARGLVTWRRTSYAGGFTLEPAKARWRLQGAVDQLDLAELPRLWPMTALKHTMISGDVDLVGNRQGLSARVARAHGNWRDLPFDGLGGTWALARGTQTIDAAAHAAGARLFARGTIGAQRLDGTVRLSGLEARRVPATWWRDLGLTSVPDGRVEALEAALSGALARPEVRGTATVTDVAQGGLRVARGRLSFDGRLGSAYALRASLNTSTARAGPLLADTVATEAALTPRRIDMTRFWAQRAESTLTASGYASREKNAWDVRVDRLAWTAGERIQLDNDGPIEFRLEPGGTIAIRRARVVSSAGALSASGHWGGDRAMSNLALDLEKLDLEALLGPVAAQYQARGVLTGHARLEGPARNAAWTVDLKGNDLRYRAYAARNLAARGRFADDAWRIEHLALDTGRGRLTFAGDLTWDAPPPWSGGPEAWNRAMERVPRWSGTLTTDSLSLAQIAEFYPPMGGWRGVLSVTAEISGRPAAPLTRMRGKFRNPGWGQASLDDFELDLDYHDEVLTVNRFAMVGPDSLAPSVTGTLPIRLGWGVPRGERLPDRPMSLAARARGLDLALVPLLIPQIAAASGRMDLDAVITGTPRAPFARGTIVVREGVVRPANREEVLTGVTGTIHLEGTELRIAGFEAHQGKRGRLTVAEGVGHLRDLRIADYAFDLDASHVTAFASGEYVIELDGKFHVRSGEVRGGPLPLPHITGNATVIEGVFLANFGDPDRQAAWQGPAVMPPWTYDITVEARNNVWWRPVDANIEGKLVDFELIQGLDRFLMLGGIEALRGRYYFLGNQFDVKSGSMFFDATAPMNPVISAVLTTEKSIPYQQGTRSREVITLTVTGRAQQPTVNMTSDPGNLSQTEIATLLTYGQLRGGSNTLGQVSQVGAEYMVRQLTRQFPELEQHFGYIEVGQKVDQNNATTSGEATARSYTTVGVSRYFTRDLLLRYSQVVSGVDDKKTESLDYQDLSAEYRINRLLFLSGQLTRRRGALVTTDQTLYNVDVRARYEY